MESKQVKDLMEAYASVYNQSEESVEIISEEVEQLDEISRSMGRRATQYRKDQEQSAHMERVRQHQEKMKSDPDYRAKHERLSQTHSGKEDQKESFDLFDYLLEYLVAEGYADTNKAALAIMANMSEEWKQSIVEQDLTARQKYLVGKVGEMNKREPGSAHKYTSGKQSPGAALDRANTSAMQMRGV